MRRDRAARRFRGGVQVTGPRGHQRVDPVRISGQRGPAKPPADLPQPPGDPCRVIRLADGDVRLGQRDVQPVPDSRVGPVHLLCVRQGAFEMRHHRFGVAAPRAHPAPDERAHEPRGDRRAVVVGQVLVGEAQRPVDVPGRDEKLAAGFQIPRVRWPVVPRGGRVGSVQRGRGGGVVAGQFLGRGQVGQEDPQGPVIADVFGTRDAALECGPGGAEVLHIAVPDGPVQVRGVVQPRG